MDSVSPPASSGLVGPYGTLKSATDSIRTTSSSACARSTRTTHKCAGVAVAVRQATCVQQHRRRPMPRQGSSSGTGKAQGLGSARCGGGRQWSKARASVVKGSGRCG